MVGNTKNQRNQGSKLRGHSRHLAINELPVASLDLKHKINNSTRLKRLVAWLRVVKTRRSVAVTDPHKSKKKRIKNQ